MENLTLGQVATAIGFLVALIAGVGTIMSKMKEWISASMKSEFDSVRKDITGLTAQIKKVDYEATKNYLVSFLAKAENSTVDDIELERFFEEYGHYTEDLHGNSYIKNKVEKLKTEGKI